MNPRIHKISRDCWHAIFRFLSLFAKQVDDTHYFVVDSFPVLYCQKSCIYADGGYTCFDLEDILQDEGIQLFAKRGSIKNRLRSPEEERLISSKRQIAETSFSSIISQFPG